MPSLWTTSFFALSPVYHGFITSRPCLCIEINDKTGSCFCRRIRLIIIEVCWTLLLHVIYCSLGWGEGGIPQSCIAFRVFSFLLERGWNLLPLTPTNFSSVLSKGHNVSREKKQKERKKEEKLLYLLTANSGTTDSSSSSALKYSEYPPLPLPQLFQKIEEAISCPLSKDLLWFF